jgi:hypothetical protein
MVEAVLEFVGRFILAVVLLFVFLPVVLVATGPFILVGSAFVRGAYMNNVKGGFKAVSQRWLDWGVYVFP